VIEGNRRLAALRWIASDQAAGADIPKHVSDALSSIPVVIVSEDVKDPALREALMGIRHVSGIKEWGGYQRAQLVATLKDKYKLESAEIAQRLGMSANEVNRRYRAFKALRQMMDHDEFGDAARPDMYPIFHEAVSLPSVRDWLGWNEETAAFQKMDELGRFYELITPHIYDDDGDHAAEPKITSYSQVRELRSILDNTEAKKILFDPSRSFHEAIAITTREQLANFWKTEVIEALEALRGIGVLELKRINQDDMKLLQDIRDSAAELLVDIEKLRK
jgi:hypothetical protein